jgi:hypothetical protein
MFQIPALAGQMCKTECQNPGSPFVSVYIETVALIKLVPDLPHHISEHSQLVRSLATNQKAKEFPNLMGTTKKTRY